MGLIARLRHKLGLPGPLDPPYSHLCERVTQLEARLTAIEEALEETTERELRWQEMNAQLRRYLGRLDAHAGKARAAAEEHAANGGGAPRPDVLAAKYPQGLPRKE